MQQPEQNKQVKHLTAGQQGWQMAKFLFFSVSAGVIQIASFALMDSVLHAPYWLAYGVALVLSVLWNFTFNRHFTFRSVENIGKAMALVFAFYVVFTPLSMIGGEALTQAGAHDYVVLLGTMVINFVTEYLYQRYVVYRYTIDTNTLAQRSDETHRAEDLQNQA
ncbi:MAG: GtrA family protein [Candidatus Limiplasma sp.]|nr:GtrA family protein [Candidatus Limiplasma sp.]MEA5144845.1 GtrA family protein [Candidatus Limiplasma sp.]